MSQMYLASHRPLQIVEMERGQPNSAQRFSHSQRRSVRRITYHPIYLFRVNIAAIGSVDDIVDEKSALSLEGAGSW